MLSVLALGGCGASARNDNRVSSASDQTLWSVDVPRGWHETHFNDSAARVMSAGIQISNVRLPRPEVVPGYPIQVNNRVLPADGVALIVATDTDTSLHLGRVATLPLAPLERSTVWTFGSALAGNPYMETVRFRASGRTFVASAKIGDHVSRRDLRALDVVVRSIHLR